LLLTPPVRRAPEANLHTREIAAGVNKVHSAVAVTHPTSQQLMSAPFGRGEGMRMRTRRVVAGDLPYSSLSENSSIASPDGEKLRNSLPIFRKFLVPVPNGPMQETTKFDASPIVTKACYDEWLKLRGGNVHEPEKTFQRTLTAQCAIVCQTQATNLRAARAASQGRTADSPSPPRRRPPSSPCCA